MEKEEDIRNLPTQYEDRTEDLIPRILIVGEEGFLADFIRKELGPRGYVLDQAYEIAEAELKLVQYFYRVVFFSMDIKGSDPHDFIKFAKGCCEFSRIIVVAGEKDMDASLNAIKSGAFDVLTKPIAIGKLKSFISDAISTDKDNIKGIALEPPAGYRIVKQLSSGSFCAVMLAEKDNKFYAIKILSRNLYSMEKLKRFFREAGILSKLEHPNIMQICEYGFSDKSEIPYIAMEYLQGKPLSEMIVDSTPLQLPKAIKILRQLTSALAAVHGHEILHRDIKPHNVIIDADFNAKLTDFGAAHVLESNLTMTNSSLGSPTYMAPESFDNIKDADARTDIFSLGIVAYEMLTGHLPFKGRTIAHVSDAIKKNRPVEPCRLNPKIPFQVQNILAKMLKKEPARRYQTTIELLKDLDVFEKNKYFIVPGFKDKLVSLLHLSKDWS
ncbi:MAG TPA: hypothetical protein DCZ94_11720 [Lentisphaeria bacterium]|nr:MAG: hypothetical protein A2X48_09680 [Lentisphaerae bacterium GWF2_49_21]HBC87615.1 hypothetical protein [Lentisphaeria bacterium]